MKWFKRKPITARDTGEAKLPGLGSVPSTGNPQLEAWLRKAAERLEVREGERGNPWERAVTVREFAEMVGAVEKIVPAIEAISGKGIDGGPISGEATEMIRRFEESIRNLKVFKDLMKRLDDPSRFDDLPGEIREILLRDLAKEAAERGADITRVEKSIQDVNRSLSYEVKTITAAVQQSQAGIREVSFAWADANRAQAGQITQLIASLGNYYQDGTPGRALLETQLGVTADRVQGLSSQITMKVQAGGALAGWGLAATENTAGAQTSAFIVSADKFAVVMPTYSPPYRPVYERDANGNIVYKNGQPVVAYNQVLANEINPAQGGIPFGVDINGIYLNNNVYVKGAMRVDTGGKTLIQGLRGSVMVLTEYGSWSDTTARNLVWAKIGNAGSAPNNNHLVIGDQATIGATTRYWNGVAWAAQGVVIRGDLLVDGSVAASKVDTYGLTIRNSSGQAVFTSGVDASIPNWFIGGLGGLATRDAVNLGQEAYGWSDLKVDGQNLYLESFINKWRKASKDNLVTFMEYGAIQEAFIGEAEIGTLRVRGENITGMRFNESTNGSLPANGTYQGPSVTLIMPAGASGVVVTSTVQVTAPGSDTHVLPMIIYKSSGGGWVQIVRVDISVVGGKTYTHTVTGLDKTPIDGVNVYVVWLDNQAFNRTNDVNRMTITAIGGKR
jgi:hypothetical protein